MTSHRLLLLGVVLVLATVPCLATPLTFANFFNSGAQDLSVIYSALGGLHGTDWLESGTWAGSTFTPGAVPITFFYDNVTTPAGLSGPLGAELTFTASSTSQVQVLGGGLDLQQGYGGSFTITLDAPYNGHLAGTYVLLAGTFTGAGYLVGPQGNFEFSDSGTNIFSSDSSFLGFNGANQAFWLPMSSITNLNVNGNGMFSGFRSSASGDFSANIIPEPFSFLLLGSGLVGLGLLRRKLR